MGSNPHFATISTPDLFSPLQGKNYSILTCFSIFFQLFKPALQKTRLKNSLNKNFKAPTIHHPTTTPSNTRSSRAPSGSQSQLRLHRLGQVGGGRLRGRSRGEGIHAVARACGAGGAGEEPKERTWGEREVLNMTYEFNMISDELRGFKMIQTDLVF